WTYWWEYNRTAFLARRGEPVTGPRTGSDDFYLGVRSARVGDRDFAPSAADLEQRVLPALRAALESGSSRDVATACMIALAKVGRDHREFALFDLLAPRLASGYQEERETAALALGLAGIDGPRELGLLIALAADGDAGSIACGREHVDDRTRAFAAYGLGLMAQGSARLQTRFRIAAALCDLVGDPQTDRDVVVAAIHGLGLCRPTTARPGERALLDAALARLEQRFVGGGRATDAIAIAHCPTAIARLVGIEGDRAEHFRASFAGVLAGGVRPAHSAHDPARSAALALGALCGPTARDRSCVDVLSETVHAHRDHQTRYFAILALGQIGGADNRVTLLREFDRANVLERPWCALALGVLEHARFARCRAEGTSPEPDRLVGETLLAAHRDSRNPDLRAALAVALGLCRYTPAATALGEALRDSLHRPELAGYHCIGLALLRDPSALPILRAVLAESERRPELMRQAATALAHLGDSAAAVPLLELLQNGAPSVTRLAAIASALGVVGDRRAIGPLLEILADDGRPRLCAAFAAAALGGVCDKDDVPWNGRIAAGINYRAAVDTLVGAGCGILDIL
ncbi:MAG: HEAT repeat domain-containing protein, partial [Planctomycetes bacterium]|nr:HEAT repeat domain-containing protein [Planctomycetota bacterium]